MQQGLLQPNDLRLKNREGDALVDTSFVACDFPPEKAEVRLGVPGSVHHPTTGEVVERGHPRSVHTSVDGVSHLGHEVLVHELVGINEQGVRSRALFQAPISLFGETVEGPG